MGKKVNTGSKLKLDELPFGGGTKEDVCQLTEDEKVLFAIMLEKAGGLQAQLEQVQKAIASLVGRMVESRKLDPQLFGVNLAAGRILPIEQPKTSDNGKKPEL